MIRLLKILAVTGLTLLLLTGFLVFLGAHVPEPTAAASLGGLTNEARIHWFDTGGRPPRIEAATAPDAFKALGFAQTQAAPWHLLLWRQAAAGRLAEWYGPTVLPADYTVRQLGLHDGAREALRSLSPDDRATLETFVEGVNAGILTARVQNDAQVTLMGVRTEPFEVADVLAIERLVAWLGTPLSSPPSAERWPDLATFRAGDARLRALLNADGFWRSRLWTYADSTEARLVATYVTGATAKPLFFDAEIVVGRRTQIGVFLPGTPFAVAGADLVGPERRTTRAWAVYPVSEAAWRTPGPERPQRRAERFVIEGGRESVQIVTTTPAGLYFRSPVRRPLLRPRPVLPVWPDSARVGADSTQTPAEALQRLATLRQARRADSLWRADSARVAAPTALVLAWGGLDARTDAAAWLTLFWRGETPRFTLFTGQYLTTGGASMGATPHRRGLVLTDSAYAAALVARLDAFSTLPDAPAQDETSTWALSLSRRLVARLDTARLRRPVDREALTYLRNWTGTFESTSVAATLFTFWLTSEAHLNRLTPAALSADTTFFEGVRRAQALQASIDTLTRHFGPDLRAWRWGKAVPHTRRFPGYGISGLGLPAGQRYAPLNLAGGGHPTTLAYGPESPSAPSATFTFEARPGTDRPVRLHRFDYDPTDFLARSRLPLLIDPVAVISTPARRITRLSPR